MVPMRRLKVIRVEYLPDELTPDARAVWPSRETMPQAEPVAMFVSAVARNPAVSIEVLGHLRRYAVGRGDPLLAYLSGCVAIAALGVALIPGALIDVSLPAQIVTASVGGVLVFTALAYTCGLVVDIDVRARFATAWLAAYEDGLALSASTQRRQRRFLRRLNATTRKVSSSSRRTND